MKPFIIILILAVTACNSVTENKIENKLKEVRTASDNILVAYIKDPELHSIDTIIEKWSLNKQTPLEISRWSTPKWDEVDFSYEHHVYLRFEEKLEQNEEYTLKTPHGNINFTFDQEQVYCESIKTNQSAYSGLSKTRFANFAIWTANGKTEKIEGKLPDYYVVDLTSEEKISTGKVEEIGMSDNSGDFVYRMDLSAVPVGGPYKVVVDGFGSSFPFGVGGQFSDRLAYISFRGLLHERCGMEQKTPYFDHDIREICHTEVYVTDSEYKEAKVTFSDSDPTMEVYGGYHDAGDCDRRDHHMMAPIFLLSMYDAFPQYFSDLQFNIPDKFDENYRPIGKGNGIPDIIDEAEWGTLIFEFLQEENGGVRAGTERNGYPTNGPTVDMDTVKYGTFKVMDRSTNIAAGLFAHLARLLKPYKPERAAELQERAEKAWNFASVNAKPAHKLYYYTQHYLLTGSTDSHAKLKEVADYASEYVDRHENNPRAIQKGEVVFGAHFSSYLTNNTQVKDPEIVEIFENAIRATAVKRINELYENPYPNGTANPNRWWGSQTAQGQYAESSILQWRLTGEQKYIDAASVLMDYNQGLNPVGKCYLTGIGFDRTEDPLHHDSYPMKVQGWGPAPGLQVFGPGNLKQINRGFVPMYPDVHSLPAQRQFVDHRRYVSVTEFTIPESITFPSVIYTILAEGGKWDGKSDPYDLEQVKIGQPFD
ncbi:MAG: glycoside hydrolase family 9 protein [Cyclobacteriaceae bacterium]